MAKLVDLQSNWKRGMKQDFPRTAMPDGSAWNLEDYLPDFDAPLTKRGGWTDGSNALLALVGGTSKASASATSGTSLSTGSITPVVNNLYLAAVENTVASGTATLPTMTGGGGLTWVQVATILSGTNTRRFTIFRALKPSGLTSGVVTADFGGVGQSQIVITVDQFSNVVATGTDGADAVVQSATAGNSVGTTASVTLAAFGNSQNATWMATYHAASEGTTPKAGWTELTEVGPTAGMESQYNTTADTAPSATFVTSTLWLAAAVEIKASLPAATGSFSAVAYAPFAAGARLMTVSGAGELYYINGLVANDIGATSGPPKQTAFHANKLILPYGTVRYYDGSTLAAIGGFTPNAPGFATVYKDRTVLGSTTDPTRIYFSAAGDPLTWDITNSWLSVGAPVTGFASLPGALMVFQATRTARLRGSTPPPEGDMIEDDPIFSVGCTDARSIATIGAVALFANPGGIYITNGTNLPTDLTKAAGIKRYWQSLMVNYDATTWTLAGGFYQSNYIITVYNGTTFVDAFMFNLDSYSVTRLTNLRAICFANATQISEELWFGRPDVARLGKFSTVFQPAAAYKNDADGTAVTPVLETPIFGANPPGMKSWRSIYIEYDCRDAASDNPTLTVSYMKNPGGAYTALTPTLPETTERGRERINVRVPSDGLALKIEQANASALTRIYAIQADVHAREQSRV